MELCQLVLGRGLRQLRKKENTGVGGRAREEGDQERSKEAD